MTEAKGDKLVYTVEEAAKLLGVAEPKMREIMKRPGFPVVNLGERLTRIPAKEFSDWLASQMEKPTEG